MLPEIREEIVASEPLFPVCVGVDASTLLIPSTDPRPNELPRWVMTFLAIGAELDRFIWGSGERVSLFLSLVKPFGDDSPCVPSERAKSSDIEDSFDSNGMDRFDPSEVSTVGAREERGLSGEERIDSVSASELCLVLRK